MARQFIKDNPKRSRAELKVGLLENTKLDITEINSILDESGIKEPEREFSENQAKTIVQAIFDSNKGFWSSREKEKENTKKQIEQGVIQIGGNSVELTQQQIEKFLEILKTL